MRPSTGITWPTHKAKAQTRRRERTLSRDTQAHLVKRRNSRAQITATEQEV
jgi:hypothetical protein